MHCQVYAVKPQDKYTVDILWDKNGVTDLLGNTDISQNVNKMDYFKIQVENSIEEDAIRRGHMQHAIKGSTL